LYKLFAFKQKLLEDTRDKEGIKWHMTLHFPLYILFLGSPVVFDMIRTEKSNSDVKNLFDHTSKRFGTAFEEILGKVVIDKALNDAIAEKDQLPDLPRGNKNNIYLNSLNYQTENNIIFYTTTGAQHREEVTYDYELQRWIQPSNKSFIHPVLDQNNWFHYLIDNDLIFEKELLGNYNL
jgi:hypothetical protein